MYPTIGRTDANIEPFVFTSMEELNEFLIKTIEVHPDDQQIPEIVPRSKSNRPKNMPLEQLINNQRD